MGMLGMFVDAGHRRGRRLRRVGGAVGRQPARHLARRGGHRAHHQREGDDQGTGHTHTASIPRVYKVVDSAKKKRRTYFNTSAIDVTASGWYPSRAFAKMRCAITFP